MILHCMYRPHCVDSFICQSTLGWLPSFGFYAALNMGVHIPSFEHVPRSGIAESHGNAIFNFFLRNHHAFFHSDCIILYFHQQCTRVPNLHSLPNTYYFLGFYIYSSHPSRCEVSFFFFSNASLCISTMNIYCL